MNCQPVMSFPAQWWQMFFPALTLHGWPPPAKKVNSARTTTCAAFCQTMTRLECLLAAVRGGWINIGRIGASLKARARASPVQHLKVWRCQMGFVSLKEDIEE